MHVKDTSFMHKGHFGFVNVEKVQFQLKLNNRLKTGSSAPKKKVPAGNGKTCPRLYLGIGWVGAKK